MSWCSPVIIAHLDASIWLNGIFWWLHQHGAVAAQFSSHLSDSISGAASWRTPDWRLQADSWKQASWGGGEGSRDAGSFIGSVWICAGSLDYLPIQRFPIPFYFFPSPIGGCHDNIEQFPWRKAEAEPLCFYSLEWHRGVKRASWPHILSGGMKR